MSFASASEMLSALAEIVVINVVLSGDNAVVIALACRSLPPRQQKLAFLIGSLGVIVLMTLLTAFASYLLGLPYLELTGSVLLLGIGVKLLLPESGSGMIKESHRLWEAVKTIIIADIVMSFDNVLGMAGAAEGHMPMLVVGLIITIPLILFGSAIIMRLMMRLPILVTVGGAVLGYVAGELAAGDPAIAGWIAAQDWRPHLLLPAAGAAIVVGLGKLLARRRETREAADLYQDLKR